eukprot:14383945-Alexandrium_andersonii.AAC.1
MQDMEVARMLEDTHAEREVLRRTGEALEGRPTAPSPTQAGDPPPLVLGGTDRWTTGFTAVDYWRQ